MNPDPAHPATSPSRIAVVLLGGSARNWASEFESELGVRAPMLALDAERTVLDAWLRALGDAFGAVRVVLAAGDDQRAAQYAEVVAPAGIELARMADPSPHRGPAGVIRDIMDRHAGGAFAEWRDVLVVEGSRPPPASCGYLAELVAHGGAPRGEIRIATSIESTPAGAMSLDRKAVGMIAPIGFVDLKEQVVSALLAAGGSVRAVATRETALHARDRIAYLQSVARALRSGRPAVAGDAFLAVGARVRGDSLVRPGAAVDERALVVDSVVLDGARIGRGAVVARSVIAPGAVVPDAAVIVDEVFTGLVAAGGAA
jgi:hypothetical protein